VKSKIYNYDERLERGGQRIIAGFGHNGEIALRFLFFLTAKHVSEGKLVYSSKLLDSYMRFYQERGVEPLYEERLRYYIRAASYSS